MCTLGPMSTDESDAKSAALSVLRRKALLWSVGLVREEEIGDIATEALAPGVDSPSLAVLATLTRSELIDQVQDLLPRALSEVGVQVPPRTSEELRYEAARE